LPAGFLTLPLSVKLLLAAAAASPASRRSAGLRTAFLLLLVVELGLGPASLTLSGKEGGVLIAPELAIPSLFWPLTFGGGEGVFEYFPSRIFGNMVF
jgi:hypothetical protein